MALGGDSRRARNDLSGVERWAIGHLLAWRILAIAFIGIVLSRLIHSWLTAHGIDGVAAWIITFMCMNAAFFVPAARAWFRAELPHAPRGWQSGARARFVIALLIVKASIWALLPLELQLFVSFIVAAASL